MSRSILAAVDGSPEALNAARSAAVVARAMRRPLALAVVVPDPAVFPAGDARRLEIARRGAIADGRAILDAVSAEIEAPDARKRVLLSGALHGGVAERLADLALEENADLVVVGTRGRGVLANLARRSVSAALVEGCDRPVMVVPTDTYLHPLAQATA